MTDPDFLGGPPELFDKAGREQLIVLLEHGLEFSSFVLDIGCGCLRGGRWIIPLLDAGHYCGIEPMREMVHKGLDSFLDPDLARFKQPRFDHNDRFDFSVFGQRFSHFMARSIWTHAAKHQIEAMLEGFVEWGGPDAVMLASFHPTRANSRKEYTGDTWVGRSHESSEGGLVHHSFRWISDACARRKLRASLLEREPLREGGQIWAAVHRA